MFEAGLYETMQQGLVTLFILGVPIVVTVSLVGLIFAAFQSATSINDAASTYGIKLIALVVLAYLMFPAVSRSILALAKLCFAV